MKINLDDETIKKLLVGESYISAEDFERAEVYAKEHDAHPIDFLIAENIITKELLGQAMAESMQVAYANLITSPPPREFVQKIPENLATKLKAVVYSENDNEVVVASSEPTKLELHAELDSLFGDKVVKVVFAFSEDIEASFVHYRKSLETRFSQIIKNQGRVAPEILDEIMADAITFNASDIHFEPGPEEVLIRFRVDGVVQEAGRIPKEFYGNVLNRIKVQSKLRIDEHFSAQDGSMTFSKEGLRIDLRTSIIPTVEGEKVTLRLLAAYLQELSLANIGLSSENQQLLTEASHKPFGMILVTGPTGSGKTTTLYSVLSMLNKPNVNITTIEDPVEYRLPGANQIQVNPQTDLTFEKGLRSIVRQDPDIILVGEIRDNQTADISVNAALTGHLLLSTLHANDASTAIPRMLEMDVEPFLLASTLEIIIGQRLLRKICSRCRFSVTKTPEDLKAKIKNAEEYFGHESITLYESKGCSNCGGTGYKGRTAVFEVIHMTPELQTLTLKHPSAMEIWEIVSKQGTRSMFEDGVVKVKSGQTTLEELLRVASPPDVLKVHRTSSKAHKADDESNESHHDNHHEHD